MGTKLTNRLSTQDKQFYQHLLNTKQTLQQVKKNKICVDVPYLMNKIETCDTRNQRLVRSLVDNVDENNFIETEFNLLGTITGRLTNKGPVNFHSLPNKQGIKRSIKSRFQDGYIIVADWNAMELRTALAMSQTTLLDPIDLHIETARKIFKKEHISEEERDQAKIINFAAIYGSTQREHIDIVKKIYPELVNFIDQTTTIVQQQGKIINLFGRRHKFNKGESYKTKIFNHYVQGIAADISLRSLYLLNKHFEKAKMDAKIILTIHDSVVIDCPKNEIKHVGMLLKQVMTDQAIPRDFKKYVLFPVTVYGGHNYEDIIKIKTIYKDEA